MAKKFNEALNQNKPAATMFISKPAAADIEITEATYSPDADELEALAKYEATPKEQRPRAEKVERRGRPKSNKEIKSQRAQLVLKPSVYEQGKERAEALGLSFNSYVIELIKADNKRHYIKPQED